MNLINETLSRASLGLALSIGMAEPLISPEADPSHVALVHGSKDAETPTLPALIHVETNRAERRRLRLVDVNLESVREDQLLEVHMRIATVRRHIAAHK